MRHLISVDDDREIDELAQLIGIDLRTRLATAAVRPQRGEGLDPSLQGHLIEQVQGLLEPHGIRPFLMSGTLLGAIRDGRFMSHDYDVDLGLLPGTSTDAVLAAVASLPGFAASSVGPRLVVESDHGVTIDIFPHYERSGLFWHATLIHEWWNTPFELESRSVDGQEFWIPENPRRYLDENYGDWAKPVVFYDLSFDTPNRQYRQNVHALRYLYSRCLRGLERGDRWLLEAASRELRATFGVDVTDNLVSNSHLEQPARQASSANAGRLVNRGRLL